MRNSGADASVGARKFGARSMEEEAACTLESKGGGLWSDKFLKKGGLCMDIEAFMGEHQNLYLIQNGIRSQCSEDPGAAVRLFSWMEVLGNVAEVVE